MDLNRLVPDAIKLLKSSPRGPPARGTPWEQLVANSLVARFRLYCVQRNCSANSTWAPLGEIHPTNSEHLPSVLAPFVVCWSDGVVQVWKEEK